MAPAAASNAASSGPAPGNRASRAAGGAPAAGEPGRTGDGGAICTDVDNRVSGHL